MNLNFDKEFNSNWNNFLNTKNLNNLHLIIDLIIEYFNDQLVIEPYEIIKLLPVKDELVNNEREESSNVLTSEEFIISFNWPDQIFYFLNEELANLNRQLVNGLTQNTELNNEASSNKLNNIYQRIFNLLKCCYILSKNFKCLSMIINTSLINQYLSTFSFILNSFNTDDTIRDYFKFICFLLIKAHDPYLNWFKKYFRIDKHYLNSKPIQTNYQNMISFKFDNSFFSFLFDSYKIFNSDMNDITCLALHCYACILNEITSPSPTNTYTSSTSLSSQNLNDNLLKAITPTIIDFIFKYFNNNYNHKLNNYFILNDEFIRVQDSNQEATNNKILFYDKNLIICRCIPLIIKVLHLSLPDKRLVDLNLVLDKSLSSLDLVDNFYIKYEIIKSYLNLITECTDKAALKITIVSKKFFLCLFEQLRLVCMCNNNDFITRDFLHEFICTVLNLVKNLLENSQPVKDIFQECSCYDLLYEILKETKVLDIDISILLNEMISEKTPKIQRKIIEKNLPAYLDDLENTEMAVLKIKLIPYMQPTAQEFSLNNISRLCTLNIKNQLKSCKNNLLFNLIRLLKHHSELCPNLIEKLFRTIQSLGKCSIKHVELKELIELLQPRKHFPYGIHVLRCFLQWAKTTNSIGLNLSILSLLEDKANLNLNLTQTEIENSNLTKLRRSSLISINQNAMNNLMKTGALSQNPQQATHFFNFMNPNSGIRVPSIKKWPGYSFTFHCWIKLDNNLGLFDKKRRQLYSFYNDYGQGFEAFFTPDCSSLIVSVCTKKEFMSVQLRELDFDSAHPVNSTYSDTQTSFSASTNINLNNQSCTSDLWHSVCIIHVPGKSPFGYSQVLIYIDGVLKKETDLKLPNLNDSFNHIRIGAACSRPVVATSNFSTSSLTAPLVNLKSMFNMTYKSGEKSLNVTSVPAGSQDTVWDPSTCLTGKMSSCFILHDVISDIQARLLHELGPNQYSINWLDIIELSDFKSKFVLHYDAKCVKDLTCLDLSGNKLYGKFGGHVMSCDNFKESLNSIGSVHLFYPLLNYLSSNQEYVDLVNNEWIANSKKFKIEEKIINTDLENMIKSKLNVRKSSFDDSELEHNVVSLILNLMRYLFNTSDLMQDRFERHNGIALLGFLLQRLPKKFIDINLLRICQEYVNEAKNLSNQSLLNSIYEHIIFDFRIWNKADYEIRIGHIQYISTIIKDDKKYFRKKYGIQFFLDIIRTYFGFTKNQITNSQHEINPNLLTEPGVSGLNQMDDEDLRNLRNSFFGLIKYYAQKDIKITELNAMISFLATSKNFSFQNDILDLLITLLEAPNSNDQLYLLLFEPNLADGMYSLIIQNDLSDTIQKKILKIFKILLKTKKVYDKNKSRIRLDECGTYAGLISKLTSEISHYFTSNYSFNENLPIELLEIFLQDENSIQSFDNLWHIMSMLSLSPVTLISDPDLMIKTRLKACELIFKYVFTNSNRQMTKTPAWQDIICQFFCYKKRDNLNRDTNLPPIIVSTTSMMETIANESDEWENLEMSNDEKTSEEKSLLTSTPSGRKKKPKNVTSTLIKSVVNNNVKKLVSMGSSEEQNCSKIDENLEENGKIKIDSFSFSSPELNSTNKEIERVKDYVIKSREVDELFEKVVYLIYKLIWESVQGSSIEAWKERYQIFSTLHRLSKEYTFIKPIELIELKLIESSLKHCISEHKKQNTGKEHMIALENSREMIKLVDYFVSQNISTISEKLVSSTITLLDQMRAFDYKTQSNTSVLSSPIQTQSTIRNSSFNDSKSNLDTSKTSSQSATMFSSVLGSYGIVHDEYAETNYLGMNILVNVLASQNIEICAQASAKINTILHSRNSLNTEEACYLIASVERVMNESLNENDEQHYAFLIPIMKCLIEKCYNLIQMNVQVPNIPHNITPSFYDDFKEYCKTDEWRIFIRNQVQPLKDQYMAMTINPCQMNMEIVWNQCHESTMISIHKRNRLLGECKIKFEDTIYSKWKQREKDETLRYNNYLLQLKRSNLTMRKQLHNVLKYLTSEIGPWNEGPRDEYWMLSNHENKEHMRCKLVENLKFDSHFEASRLRDYSGYEHQSMPTLTQVSQDDKNFEKLRINKEAINSEINEDAIAEDEFIIEKSNQVQNEQGMSRKTSVSTITSQSSSIQSKLLVIPDQEHYDSMPQLEEKEKVLIKSECELITPTRVIKGRFELTNKYIYFFDTFSPFYYIEQNGNDSSDNVIYYECGNLTTLNNTTANANVNNSITGFSCHDFDILNDFKVPLTQLKEVQLRRYNLRRSALEFFLINETGYFINFNKTIRNKIYTKIVSMKLPYLQSNPSIRTPADLLKASEYTQKWVNHEMTNFEYLMKLNTIAGRSYNDLSQYPIFPWILKDYTSENLNLNDESIYRDLSKPIGVQNKKFENYVREKYQLFEDPTGSMRPFHYGTHYSNAANVMHYLVRLEPFTTLHIQLQSDRFDIADRQFYSIASSWKILYESPNDVKELIPEFFYLSEFLTNMNNFDFGELQANKNRVHDVTLPKWAKNPEHFIYMHRKALESEYVSSHLHEWIDLIFGYKQQGVEAEKALNVFMYCSYEGAIDLDAITDPVARTATEGMISNFGQIPTQLLKEPHPKRKTLEQSIKDKITQGKPVILWHHINSLKAYYVDFCDGKKDDQIDPVIFINIPRNQIRSFMQQGLSDPLITICQSGVVGVNGWQAYERSLTNLFSFEKDPSLLNERTKKSISGPFDPNLEIDYKLFVLTHDSKLLISGAHWDNSIRVFSFSKYRNIAQLYQHSNIVTCLAIDYTSSFIVSGSKDCTCIIWQIIQEYGNCINLEPSPIHVLYGHTDTVTSVEISNELDIVLSGSLDGTVNIHTLKSGRYVQTLNFNNEFISLFTSINLKLSNERHILIYTSSIGIDKNNDEESRKSLYEIFVYSINGQLTSREKLNFPVQDMIFKDNYLILALLISHKSPNNNENNTSFNSSLGDVDTDGKKGVYYTSKIVFKDYYDMKTVQTMRLKAPITCMNLTRDDSHLLVGLKDGKLIVITGDRTLK
ncbi:unnamed protein product [Brachionus calyciflorus]|uniref:Uncharacterized protein n=1 Tax=Brachionus calyciflorus TaxID=104777 RepID=A0A813RQ24_9BILA|nr:unnamed protein product [Brachionus calyciflorus]